ncbi:family J-like protein [Mycoplasmoides pneumoniae]|uniref:family J-like protein n=1 Tax=Mycoplasmoides pneumoniae TaxID=2104 RepID=UPI001330719C|nr:family J-like protein [Mycoplasmoides pneumoniae]
MKKVKALRNLFLEKANEKLKYPKIASMVAYFDPKEDDTCEFIMKIKTVNEVVDTETTNKEKPLGTWKS